jgi:hypothetical protein
MAAAGAMALEVQGLGGGVWLWTFERSVIGAGAGAVPVMA